MLIRVVIFVIGFLPTTSGCFGLTTWQANPYGTAWSVDDFPYQEFLKHHTIWEFDTLAAYQFDIDQRLVQSGRQSSNGKFLFNLVEAYLYLKPIDKTNLDSTILLGEAFLGAKYLFPLSRDPGVDSSRTHSRAAFGIVGHFILNKAARYIMDGHRNKAIDLDDTHLEYIRRLEVQKINVSIEISNFEKVVQNIRKGNFRYAWSRILLEIESIPIRRRWLIWAMICFILVVASSRIRTKRAIMASSVIGILAGIALLLFKNTEQWESVVSKGVNERPLAGVRPDNSLIIKQLVNSDGNQIGYSFRMDAADTHGSYLVDNPRPRFNETLISRKIKLATSGGFLTNFDFNPDGFALEVGHLKNALISNDRDGLVIFFRGAIFVSDLASDSCRLPNGISLLNPSKSLNSYAALTDWCTDNKVDAFQTHLLAKDDQLRIDPTRAPKGKRERRLLAISMTPSGQRFYTIFDFFIPAELAAAATMSFHLLKQAGYNDITILNLDTGSFDFLTVFDQSGSALEKFTKDKNVVKMRNVVIFSEAN